MEKKAMTTNGGHPNRNTGSESDGIRRAEGSMRATRTPATAPRIPDTEKSIDPVDGIDADAPAGLRSLPETFLDERDDVLSVIHELEDQIDRHQVMHEGLQRELNTANEKLSTATQRLQELEWQNVTLQTRIHSLEQVQDELTLLEEEANAANTRATRLEEQLARTEKDNGRLKEEIRGVGKQLEELWSVRKERDGLRVEVRKLAARADELDRTSREATEERAALQTKLAALETKLEESRTAHHQAEIALRTAEERQREQIRVAEALTEKINSLRDEKKALQAQVAHLERENARLVEQFRYQECEIASLRNHTRNAETALSSVKKAFAEVRVALNDTKTRARRHTLETLPRTGSSLRPVDVAETTAAGANGKSRQSD